DSIAAVSGFFNAVPTGGASSGDGPTFGGPFGGRKREDATLSHTSASAYQSRKGKGPAVE
ncbi:hypothetical protein HK097_005822, partial [Rhizophlyctis rosea]